METKIMSIMGKRFFVIDSGIKKTAYREGITSLLVKNDEGNVAFRAKIDLNAENGSVNDFSITFNGVTDSGNLAVVIKINDEKNEDLKRKYGAALVAVETYLNKLYNQMRLEANTIDGIFAGIELESETISPDEVGQSFTSPIAATNTIM